MRICLVKLSAMGDIIHMMVVLEFIKKKIPNIKIDWVVEKIFAPILENNPNIDNILEVDLKSIKNNKLKIIKQIKLLYSYKINNYDIVIDAQGLIKSAICSKIIGDNVTGFDKYSVREKFASLFYNSKTSIGYDKNIIKRNCKLISQCLKVEITDKEIIDKKPFLFFKETNKQNIDIIFVIGASKKNKIYPKESFSIVANSLQKYSIEVVWGTKSEFETANYLENCNKNVKKSNKLNLNQLKAKISGSRLVIGADTGPTHMAWGLNIPSITIFGNTPYKRNTYITSINKVVNSSSKVDALSLDKNDFSIKKINPNRIIELAKKLLENG